MPASTNLTAALFLLMFRTDCLNSGYPSPGNYLLVAARLGSRVFDVE
jgi:hypothetical protein